MQRFSNPVFVSGHTRSGTNLLMRLIDGAPGILVPPGEGKLNVLRRLLALPYPLSGNAGSVAELVWSNIELNLDAERETEFRRVLADQFATHPDPRGYIDTVCDLLTAVTRFVEPTASGSDTRRWMEKNHNLEFFWNRAVFLFGRPKLLFVLRDPFDNWLSWREYMARNALESSIDFFGGIMRQHCENELAEATFGASIFETRDALAAHYGMRVETPRPDDGLELSQSFDPALLPGVDTAEGRFAWNYRLMYERAVALRERSPDVMIVRYEDMVLNTATTMREVIAFLGCEWSDANLAPTDHGRAWRGNSSFASVAGIVDQHSVGRGAARLEPAEIANLRRVLADMIGEPVDAGALRQ